MVLKPEHSPYYVLGVLNSKLLTFYLQRIGTCFQGGYFAYEPNYLQRMPIRDINFSNPADKANHDLMVELVQRMLSLHEKLQAARISQEKTFFQHQINATDHQIDRLVYELYGLSEDEIEIIEG